MKGSENEIKIDTNITHFNIVVDSKKLVKKSLLEK